MSAKNSTNRAALLQVAALLRPALSTQDYIPALKHIKFDGAFASAYNDISAIVVACEVDIKRCVPGDLLIRALGSFGGETVALAFDDKTSALLLSSGRSKLKLPTLPAADFPFDVPQEVADEIVLTPDILKGIERCLLSVGSDPTHPAQMGVTLDSGLGGHASLYSTDNFTISYYQTKDAIKLPGESPVIMPTFFCEQLLSLAKAHPRTDAMLVLLAGALLVDFIDEAKNTVASLFTKTVVDLEPLDFGKIINKHVGGRGSSTKPTTIPPEFDAAFERALLVLSNELDKSTLVSIDDNSIVLNSTSAMGDADDEIEFKTAGGHSEFHVDPTLVVRASKSCSKVAFMPKVLMLTNDDGNFTHLIAHCAV